MHPLMPRRLKPHRFPEAPLLEVLKAGEHGITFNTLRDQNASGSAGLEHERTISPLGSRAFIDGDVGVVEDVIDDEPSHDSMDTLVTDGNDLLVLDQDLIGDHDIAESGSRLESGVLNTRSSVDDLEIVRPLGVDGTFDVTETSNLVEGCTLDETALEGADVHLVRTSIQED